ncbi:MAG: hypothetical protein JW893_08940 [Candidatus Omnitrophica bacterium]|nr:hypothetical protein [Candidatus Omnitrophota bacterium]
MKGFLTGYWTVRAIRRTSRFARLRRIDRADDHAAKQRCVAVKKVKR